MKKKHHGSTEGVNEGELDVGFWFRICNELVM